MYSFEQWSEGQADRYLSSFEDGLAVLVSKPETGTQRDALRKGYWSKRIEHHVVFYTFTETELRIRRVLHEVMDPDLHLCCRVDSRRAAQQRLSDLVQSGHLKRGGKGRSTWYSLP